MTTLQNSNKIYDFALTVSNCDYYLQFGVTVADGFLQCIRSNWLCATFAESLPVFIFLVLLGYSLMSLCAENLLDSDRF